ncbi:MAG: putative DNA-binding protein, partial [Firmicutes bacterium]|nr:putative DNA-binding protein [Bacillota bacterium]
DIMSKDLTVSLLMDFYGQLLTDKQLDALDMYYNQDLSLAEIAEDTGISRQAARDFIKKGEGKLREFEDKLKLAKRFEDINAQIKQIREIIDGSDVSDEAEKNRIKEILDRLSDEL